MKRMAPTLGGLMAALGVVCVGIAASASGSPLTLVGEAPKTLTPAELTATQKAETPGKVSADKKTLTFSQREVHLVAVTGPDDDMLSYRIGGLRNPTIAVPKGATITVLFVNTDDDMFHNIRFGPWQAQWPNVMTAAALKASVGTPPLPHKSETALHGEALSLRMTQPGRYAYFCTVRGHAQGGMWGTVLVR